MVIITRVEDVVVENAVGRCSVPGRNKSREYLLGLFL